METKTMKQEKTKLKCPFTNCNYEWESRTKMFWVCCPKCQRKFKTEEQKE